MRNLKSILFFLVLAAAFASADYLLYFGRGGHRERLRTSLVDPVLAREVETVTVGRRGAVPLSLARAPGGWRIVSPYVANADEQVVRRLLDAVSLTRIQDVMSESDLLRLGRTRTDFSLDDPVLRVTVRTATETVTVGLGAPTPGADGIYASVGGVSALFVVPTSVLSAADVTAEGLRCRALFLPEVTHVAAFGLKRGVGMALEFARDVDGWKAQGTRVSTPRVSKFLDDLVSAQAADFVWPVGASNETDRISTSLLAGYGLDPDGAVTVTVKGEEGRDRQVSFGKAAGDGKVYALVQNGSAVVTVPAGLREAAAQDVRAFTESRLFPVEARTVGYLSLSFGDLLISLSLGKDGQWALESPIAAPADRKAVLAILSRVLSLTTTDVVGTNGVAVSIATNDTRVLVSRESVFGGDAVESLRSPEMLKVDPLLVRRIVRTPEGEGAKPVSVVYGREAKAWKVEGGADEATVRVSGVEAILKEVSPLTAVRIERLKVPAADLQKYGLDKPSLTIAIDQQSDESPRRNILLGSRTAGGRYATVGAFDAVFVISDESAARLASEIVGIR